MSGGAVLVVVVGAASFFALRGVLARAFLTRCRGRVTRVDDREFAVSLAGGIALAVWLLALVLMRR